MTDENLNTYMEDKKKFFTGREQLLYIKKGVDDLLNTTKFTPLDRLCAVSLFEFLCFTIHTSEGKALYLQLLNHVSRYCPHIAEKYWKIFDNQENLKERYRK